MKASSIPRFREGRNLLNGGSFPRAQSPNYYDRLFSDEEISPRSDGAGEAKVGTLGEKGGAGVNSPAPPTQERKE